HPPALPSFPTRRSSDLASAQHHQPEREDECFVYLFDFFDCRLDWQSTRDVTGQIIDDIHHAEIVCTLIYAYSLGQRMFIHRKYRSEEHTSELQSRFDLV